MKLLPAVVLTNLIFLGHYDYSIGTNTFFEEVNKETVKKSPFEKETPIHLQYVLKETKVLRMTKLGAKLPLINAELEPKQMKRFAPKLGYKEILSKWSQGILNVEDYFVNLDSMFEHKKEVEQSFIVTEMKVNSNPNTQIDTKHAPKLDAKTRQITEDQPNACVEKKKVNTAKRIVNKDSMQEKYNQLQQLSKKPLKSKLHTESPNFKHISISQNETKKVIKNTLLHDTEHQEISLKVRDDTIEDFVNIPNSIRDAVISSTNLRNKDKVNLLSPSNFKNFTPFVKLIVLNDFLKTMEEDVNKMCEEELEKEDEYGWNPRERCELLQSLIEELQFFIESQMSSVIGKNDSDNEKNKKDVENHLLEMNILNAG